MMKKLILGAAEEILPVYASPTEWVFHELG